MDAENLDVRGLATALGFSPVEGLYGRRFFSRTEAILNDFFLTRPGSKEFFTPLQSNATDISNLGDLRIAYESEAQLFQVLARQWRRKQLECGWRGFWNFAGRASSPPVWISLRLLAHHALSLMRGVGA